MRTSRPRALPTAILILVVALIGATAAMLASAAPSQPSFRDFKLQQIAQVQDDMSARARGPRRSEQELRAQDPGRAVVPGTATNEFVYFRVPCPSETPDCPRYAPPLAGDGKFFRVTNYYLARQASPAWAAYAAASLTSPGLAIIIVEGDRPATFSLPLGVGVPILSAVEGGRLRFTTSLGHEGYLDLVSRDLVLVR